MKRENKENLTHNFSCLKHLKLKNQLLILISFLIILIVTYVVCASYVHSAFVQFYFTQSSEEIYTKLSSAFIQTQLNKYESYFTSLFDTNGQTLISVFQLYNYLKKKNKSQPSPLNPQFNMLYGGKDNDIPQAIISPDKISKYNSTISFICYTNKTKFNDILTDEEILNIKTQEQLQAFGPIIHKGMTTYQELLSVYVKSDNILMTYPCLQRYDIDSYIPEKRGWYLEGIRNFQNHVPYDRYNFSLTSPYLLFQSIYIGLSMAMPFVDSNLQLIGGAAFDLIPNLLIANLVQQFGQDFTSIYLVTLDGILVMHPYKITPKQLPLYFYNTSITGFTEEDWVSLNSVTISSNCKNQTNQKELNCLFNSFYNQDMFVSMQTISSFNISIVVQKLIYYQSLISSSEFNKFQEDYNDNLVQQLTTRFYISLIQLISVFLFLCLVIYFTTNQLFRPIETIIEFTISKIQKQSCQPKLISKILQHFLSVQIAELYQSCNNFYKLLERFSFTKSSQCQQIENLQYPILNGIYFLSKSINFKHLKYYSKKTNEQNMEHYSLIKNIVRSAFKSDKKKIL
ncbi:unnamed protein product (macronuclear) [Paramecium tetraurelia]|uniref:Cache domain-containing protein n=1 Tax=Paramecium tetraurelia TaxID=5888 RepID=A0DL94_PARTE|nr:uncharacterized protein GSPATT00018128001 [Paramecium tetraurelia]CAK83811.1 unnamed protein product [Paramecium tetraurelia]|eukprot:XP_001451208.1 hypothetical protein (macronuclear) [Paramecium tetraurelia strain d4-2]